MKIFAVEFTEYWNSGKNAWDSGGETLNVIANDAEGAITKVKKLHPLGRKEKVVHDKDDDSFKGLTHHVVTSIAIESVNLKLNIDIQ